MLIEWQNTLLVGYEPIDREHQALVALINELYDDIKARRPRETIEGALFAVADKVAAHFNHENALMLEYRYPDRTDHLLEHRKLIDRLDSVLDRVDLLDDGALLETIGFMDRWFVDHVVSGDAQLGAFLCGKAVSAA